MVSGTRTAGVCSLLMAVATAAVLTRSTFEAAAGSAAGQLPLAPNSLRIANGPAPLITLVSASAITASGAKIVWTTSVPGDSQVDYGPTTAYGSSSALHANLVTAHVTLLSGLSPNKLYHYRVRSRDAAGNLAISGDFTFSTLPGALWPNEPAGFTTRSDQPWDALTGNGWNYLRRTSSKDATIAVDNSAPFSPSNALRMVFTTDMSPDSEPSVHWIGLSRPREVYSGWWMKVSPNWSCSPAGCGKITFLFPDGANGAGVTYSNLANAGNGAHYVNITTTWPSTGYRFWEPNVTRTIVSKNEWFRVEWYVKWASAPGATDGIIRWWVNGVLNGDYRTLPFPGIAGFLEFQHAPTLQNPPPSEQYMYIDHTHVSTP
jgi:hypothetical protein